ncbi:MAG TPA: LuxR C-terminal-related transcriptional regulator [Alteraurantiacibacter sp.]|jgi:DNA-binding CsgD family transcriptional regulator
MGAADSTTLTARQLAVLERLAARKSYKEIGHELGISETRVKQHVRTLKDRLGVNSPSELVEAYWTIAGTNPFLKGEELKSELPDGVFSPSERCPDDREVFHLEDSLPFRSEAQWVHQEEPEVVPGMLNGRNASLSRLALILIMTLGMFAVLILGLTSAQVLSDSLENVSVAPAKTK